jgi:H+/Cl- antiporter ClcA
MDSTPFAEVFGWFANALAVVAVFGALVALIIESGNHHKEGEPKAAPILAVVGVIIFLAGNILRYVFAAL